MTDDPDNLLDPKANRPPAEVGRAIFRLLDRHEALRVTRGDAEYDVRIVVADEAED